LDEGNSSFSNKGQGPFQRGDIYTNVKMGWGHLKILFSGTTGPILNRFGTNHPWGFIKRKGIALLQWEIIAKE
jgi:hypothetical protein